MDLDSPAGDVHVVDQQSSGCCRCVWSSWSVTPATCRAKSLTRRRTGSCLPGCSARSSCLPLRSWSRCDRSNDRGNTAGHSRAGVNDRHTRTVLHADARHSDPRRFGLPGVMGAATALAEILRSSTGYPLPVSRRGDQPSAQSSHRPRASNLNWSTRQSSAKKATDSTSPPEQSSSARTPQRASSTAWRHCGSSSRVRSRATPCSPARGRCRLHVTDEPRFAWHGAILDAARHFFSVEKVKRYIDLLAMCKINVLHLHLADDQGWCIEIDSWPRLATYGGSTEVGGGPGGYYTKEQ